MPPSASPSRILVVDDEIISQELCRDILEEKGHAVQTVATAQEALSLLKKQTFRLVLTDINMPVMDGLELLRRIKTQWPHVEVILMTAFGMLQSAVEAIRAGAYDYISKPFTGDELLASVGRALEKERLARELREAQGQLIEKEKLAALGAMSGWLAHRMRNPLNVILMCSQYLKARTQEKNEQREVVLAIEDKVEVLENMIRHFVKFSRDYRPTLVPEDLHALLERTLEGIAPRCKIQGVLLDKKWAKDLPPVPLDKDLMEEVFTNLLDNALEAMGGKGIITVATGQNGSSAWAEVANTGAPMEAHLMEKVFEPFFTTKDRGTGLGLCIARKVVESHGGKIAVTANPETAFRITLPKTPSGSVPAQA